MSASNSDAALAIAARMVVQLEGTRLAPYQDSAGVWTIGNGTIVIDGLPVGADTPPIALDRAYELMMGELRAKQVAVDASLTVNAPISQRAALYSFAYNEGVGAERSSSALRLLNAGDVAGAADALLLWNKVRDPESGALVVSYGLVNRRKYERAVFLGQISP